MFFGGKRVYHCRAPYETMYPCGIYAGTEVTSLRLSMNQHEHTIWVCVYIYISLSLSLRVLSTCMVELRVSYIRNYYYDPGKYPPHNST